MSLDLPSADPLPEPPQPPDPAYAPALLPPPPVLRPLAPPPLPDTPDPPPQPVLDPLPLHLPPPRHQRGRDHHAPARGGAALAAPSTTARAEPPADPDAGDALGWEHGARDEGLGGGPDGEAAREPDGGEGARELAADDGRVGQEDVPRHEVGEGGPRGAREQGGQDGAGAAEARAVEDGRQGEGAELVARLAWWLAHGTW